MNTKQLKYAVELSKTLNMSRTAEMMGITQPALSKQIINLERELGVKLFDRNTVPMTLTPAGEYFLAEAERLLLREDMLLRSLEDFKTGKRGVLTIGVSPFRSQYLMPRILWRVNFDYPEVKIVLREAGSDRLRAEAAEGKYDFAIVNLPVDESVLDVTPMKPDELVLAVPPYFADEYLPEKEGEISVEDLRDMPFVAVSRSQEMRQLLDRSCAAAGFEPKVAVEVVGLSTAYAMCADGLGATLLPRQFVEYMEPFELRLYTVRGLRTRQPVIVTRRDAYISEYAEYAIRLLTE